jgi:hypothetical protein
MGLFFKIGAQGLITEPRPSCEANRKGRLSKRQVSRGAGSRGSGFHRSDGTLIERHRLDQGEHTMAGAKRELVDGLTRS